LLYLEVGDFWVKVGLESYLFEEIVKGETIKFVILNSESAQRGMKNHQYQKTFVFWC